MIDDPRLLVIGSRKLSENVLTYLADNGHSVVGAIGRANGASRVGYQSLTDVCDEREIPVIETSDINGEEAISFLSEENPDICLCCGWTQIISEEVLRVPSWGTVGVHASKLPKGRGGAPVNWQIIHGNDSVWISAFEFITEVDHGDILGQTSVPIESRDDIRTVYEKISYASMKLLESVITDISSKTVEPMSQSFDDATYRPQRKPKDGLIDWTRQPEPQWNWIRAQTHPYPGAFTFYEGSILRIWKSAFIEPSVESGFHGEVLDIRDGTGIDVRSGDGIIRLQRVQKENHPEVWADEFADHAGLSAGDVLGQSSDYPDWLYTGIRGPDGGVIYETNVRIGSVSTTTVICSSYDRCRRVRVEATLDDETIYNEDLAVNGRISRKIEAKISTPGSHLLTVKFFEENEQIDTRYLKIYGTRNP